jgi:adenine-specific DNA methylase
MQRPNKKGWGVETYWIPPTFLEQNVLRTFQNRFKTILKGKEEANREIGAFFSEGQSYRDLVEGKATAIFLREDARNLPLENESVDYIFTDPPYGDTIQYFELSFVHNEWLGERAPFDQEIIVNPRQGKGDNKYRDMLIEAFKEAYRVLKPNKYMTVTFHSKSIRYWNTLLYAIQIAGFTYVDAVYQAPQNEYTDWIHAQDPGRMSGDIYITFFKSEV